ncbi:hypothetical protein CRENBAI_017237 [Crenichthys baileyi]|uniref:Uncharacterized protein n=1 Tax=Crenichthys baileyi TaxID=28760 RepID=A0AAV9R112_9TELE
MDLPAVSRASTLLHPITSIGFSVPLPSGLLSITKGTSQKDQADRAQELLKRLRREEEDLRKMHGEEVEILPSPLLLQEMEEAGLILPVSPVLIPGRKRSGLLPAVSATSTSSHRRRPRRKHSAPAVATPAGFNLPAAALPEPSKSAAALPEPSKSAAALPEPSKSAAALPEPSKSAAALPEPSKSAAALPEPSKPAAITKLSVLEAARAEFPTFTVAVATYLASGTAPLFFLEQAKEEQKRCTVLNDLLSRLMDSPSLWKQKLKVLDQMKCWVMEWGNFFQSPFMVEVLETERQRIILENSSSDSVLVPTTAGPLDSGHAAKPLDSGHAAKPLDSAKYPEPQHAAKLTEPLTQVPEFRKGFEDEPPLTLAKGQTDCAPGQTDCAPGQTDWGQMDYVSGTTDLMTHYCLTFQPVSTPDTLQPASTPDTLQPASTPDKLQPASTPDTLQPASTPDTLQPASTPDTLQPASTPDTLQPASTPDTLQPELQPDYVAPDAPDFTIDYAPDRAPDDTMPGSTPDAWAKSSGSLRGSKLDARAKSSGSLPGSKPDARF